MYLFVIYRRREETEKLCIKGRGFTISEGKGQDSTAPVKSLCVMNEKKLSKLFVPRPVLLLSSAVDFVVIDFH